MDNKNTKQGKKKSSGGGVAALIIFIVIWLLNRFDSSDFHYFFSRLRRMLRTGRFSYDGGRLAVILGVVLVIIVLIVVLSRALKSAKERRIDGVQSARGGGTAAQHSHDRLQGYAGDENGAEHWKKQLDGFLEAGIIDRSDYRALLERRRK